jgi:simple sugar transport system ATP-binding protein
MKRIRAEELTKMGIVIPDLERPVGSLSGGQRQVVAIARAIHFGVVLKLGRVALDAHRDGLTLEQLTADMAGGQELTELSHELRGAQPGKVVTPHVVEHGGVAAPTLDGDGRRRCRGCQRARAGRR